jgi:DNA-binding NarL/FixJ family response regulator
VRERRAASGRGRVRTGAVRSMTGARSFTNDFGPLAGLAGVLGLTWLAVLLYAEPPRVRPCRRTVPDRCRYATPGQDGGRDRGADRLPAFPGWQKLVGFITSATVLSFSSGLLVLAALRRQLPDQERPFRLGILSLGWGALAMFGLSVVIYLVAARMRLSSHSVVRGLEQTPRDEPEGLAACWPAPRAPPRSCCRSCARTRPDVVLLDYHVPGADGLQLCQRLKRELSAPAVVVYSAYAEERLQVPALIAGADALVNKGVPARELFEAIRLAARGESAIGPVAPEHVHAAMEAVGPTDAPIIAMLLDRTPPAAIARALGMDAAAVGRRIERIIGRLRAETPIAAG